MAKKGVGRVEVEYAPTPKQKMFHASIADEILFGGAAGGGKSKAVVMDAFIRCLTYPKTHAYVFRRTYAELEDTVIREAQNSYPEGACYYVGNRHEYIFPNGSVIHFRHCAHSADRFQYKGAEIQWLYFDELTSFEQEVYDFIKTRLRARKDLNIRPCIRSTSNPGDIGHAWVKKRFVDPAPHGEIFKNVIKSSATGEKKVYKMQYIPALLTENPHIGKDYLFQLEQKPEALRNALLYGDWDAFEGQVFTEWLNKPENYQTMHHTHVVAPFPIPLNWPRYMSFDHGYSKPFSVGWWAVDPAGRAYRYREWYGCEPGRPNTGIHITPRQIVEGILAREAEERENNIRIDRIADPAIFDRSRGDSVAQQMEPQSGSGGSAPGIYFRPGENNRMSGKMEMHERLRLDAEGKPKLYVFSTCEDFIRTIPALPYSLTKVEDVDSDAEDHIYDETRYFLMSRPICPKEARQASQRHYDPFHEYGISL